MRRLLSFSEICDGYAAESNRLDLRQPELEWGLLQVHEFVAAALATTHPAYRAVDQPMATLVQLPLSRFKGVGLCLTDWFLHHFEVSPEIELYRRASVLVRQPQTVHWPSEIVGGMSVAKRFNRLISTIRELSRENGFALKATQRQESMMANISSANSLIDKVTGRVRNVHVFRLDLRYAVGAELHETARSLGRDFARLKNSWRKHAWHSSLRGYMWKLQYGLQSGYHVHLILMLDVLRLADPDDPVSEITKAWGQLRGGSGVTLNATGGEDPYFSAGGGFWPRETKKLCRDELRRGVYYLIQKDRFFRVDPHARTKIFGRSNLAATKGSKDTAAQAEPERLGRRVSSTLFVQQ